MSKDEPEKITARNKVYAELRAKGISPPNAAVQAGYSEKRKYQTSHDLERKGIPDTVMQQYNIDSFRSLHKVATKGKSEMARVVAADKLLTRTHDMPYNSKEANKAPNITINIRKLSDLANP